MDLETRQALSSYLLAWADDQLILGHRDSEWCGHAPIIEEDIAFANIALDEIGHAGALYGLVAELNGEDPENYPDRMVYHREAAGFRNAQLVELPRGDWAFTILRQYLFDRAETAYLQAWQLASYAPLAEVAGKIYNEELYHLRHTEAWVRRLGQGTVESHVRLQKALHQLWPYTAQLFAPGAAQDRLGAGGWIGPTEQAYARFHTSVMEVLNACDLDLPGDDTFTLSREHHTRHLKVLLEEMQSVARAEPDAEW